jgi:hypothetical protein
MKFNAIQFVNSITGLSAITGATLIATKRYDIATILFAALSIGSAGIIWERYSKRVGSHLSLKALASKEKPTWEGELDFATCHLPYPVMAALAYFLSKRYGKN